MWYGRQEKPGMSSVGNSAEWAPPEAGAPSVEPVHG
jgi:hypothetical protein